MSEEINPAENLIQNLGRKQMDRRGFLRGMWNTGKAVGVGYIATKLDVLPVTAQNTESSVDTSVVSRESENFNWPEDIRGNESFLGNDILITIDDCYDIESTKAMVSLMEEKDVRATFFPNTQYLDSSNDETKAMWKDIKDKGFDIGYHTVHHTSGMTQAELAEDLSQFEGQMRTLLDDPDYKVKFVRPPEGNWNKDWMDWVHANSLTNVRWNFVPSAKNGSVDYFKAVMANPDGGRIILLHPREFDSKWLTSNIDELKATAEGNEGECASLTGNS